MQRRNPVTTTMTDAGWRASSAALAEPEAASAERTPLHVGLLRLGLAAAAVATGSPWALPVVLWMLLAHVLLED